MNPGVRALAPLVPVPFVYGLEPERQRLVLKAAELVQVDINERLIEQSQMLTRVYLLLGFTHASARRRIGGREKTERIYAPGDLVGAEALLGHPSRHTVTVQMDNPRHLQVCAVPVAKMRTIVEADPDIFDAIENLRQGWHDDAVVREDALRDHARGEERLWRVAVRLIERSPGIRPGHLRQVSQDDLAALSGMSRQTASSIIRDWQCWGRVRTGRRELTFTHYHPHCPPYEPPCNEPSSPPFHRRPVWRMR